MNAKPRFSRAALAVYIENRVAEIQNREPLTHHLGWSQVDGHGEESNRDYGEFNALLTLADEFEIEVSVAVPSTYVKPPKPIMLPTVHLNGTSATQLKAQTLEAAHAIRKALDAMAEAAPHARDYYPQGDGAFTQAAAEHRARTDALRKIAKDLEQISLHIDRTKGR